MKFSLIIWLLVGGFLALWFHRPFLLLLSILAILSLLASIGGASPKLSLLFFLWGSLIGGAVFYLADSVSFGVATFVALVGFWIVPVLIWPLGFLRDFDSWLER